MLELEGSLLADTFFTSAYSIPLFLCVTVCVCSDGSLKTSMPLSQKRNSERMIIAPGLSADVKHGEGMRCSGGRSTQPPVKVQMLLVKK